MKVTVNQLEKLPKETKYPYIGYYKNSGGSVEKTVWFTKPGNGVLMKSNRDYDKAGEAKDFAEEAFIPLIGEVILSND